MSAGMADIIAAHSGYTVKMPRDPHAPFLLACNGCGDERPITKEIGKVRTTPERHAAHVAEELAKAGYGNVQEALVAAADAMPIETLEGADKASVWLRQRAHANDPEGRALVQAIHNRKAQGMPDHTMWCRGDKHEGPCQRGRASGTEA